MKIAWTKLALADLDRVHESIAADKPSAAASTIARIEDLAEHLRQFPGIGRVGRVPGTRELVVPGTPFILSYRIARGKIEVLAVIHAARKWRN